MTLWRDGSPTGRLGSVLEAKVRTAQTIYPEDFTAANIGGGSAADATAAIQAALDTSSGAAPKTVFFGNPPYNFSNLLLNAYTGLCGVRMSQTSLVRVAGSTGTAIRERTSAEGNGSGGTGIWLRDLQLSGNGTAGDGLVLGFSVPGVQLGSGSGLDNVFVRDFPGGKGMYLNQNAVKASYLWASANNIGIQTAGGANLYDGIWAEGNTTNELIMGGSWDTFSHIQIETHATQPVLINGYNNSVLGMYIALFADYTNPLISIDTVSGATLYVINVVPNAHTYTNTLTHNIGSYASGAIDHIPAWAEASFSPAIFYNQNTARTYRVGGASSVITTTQAANYTLVLTDADTVLEGTKATAQTITVPPNSSVAFPIGTVIEIAQQGAGQITLTPGAGVTIRTPSSLTTRAQYSTVGIRKRGTDEWVASGDLT